MSNDDDNTIVFRFDFGVFDEIDWVLQRGLDRPKQAKRELEAGGSPNRQGWLRVCASRGDVGVVRLLIAHGAKLNLRDGVGRTALIKASEKGHMQVVHALVAAGAKVNVRDKDDRSALTYAAWHGRAKVVSYLLKQGAVCGPEDLTLAVGSGERDRVRIAQQLLEAGAEVNPDSFYTPLTAAVEDGPLAVISMLLKAGADIDYIQDGNGTAVHQAIENDRPPALKILLRFHPDLSIRIPGRRSKWEHPTGGMTALELARHLRRSKCRGLIQQALSQSQAGTEKAARKKK